MYSCNNNKRFKISNPFPFRRARNAHAFTKPEVGRIMGEEIFNPRDRSATGANQWNESQISRNWNSEKRRLSRVKHEFILWNELVVNFLWLPS